MSVTFTVGCPSALIVADTLPPSVFTATAMVASVAMNGSVTSQSPTNGAICAEVGGDGWPWPWRGAVERAMRTNAHVAATTAMRAERITRGMGSALSMSRGPTFLSLSWGPTPTTCQRFASLAPVVSNHSLLGARLCLCRLDQCWRDPPLALGPQALGHGSVPTLLQPAS